MEPGHSQPAIEFGPYSVDVRAGELRKGGSRIRIQEKPLRILALLAQRPGEMVTRAELQKELWPGDTFVDFEDGLNTAVKKLREALNDSAEKPQYIETVPRRGYRFLGQLESASGANGNGANGNRAAATSETEAPDRSAALTAEAARSSPAMEAAATARTESALEHRLAGWRLSRTRFWLALSGLAAVMAGAVAVWLLLGRPAFSFNAHDSVLVTDFENRTGDPRFDEALLTAFTVSLEQSRHANVFPRARLAGILRLMGKTGNERITPELGREICQREGIRGLIASGVTRTGQEYALTAELVDPQTGETVRSYAEHSYGEDHLLDALDVIAADVRGDLGESLYHIHAANRPLPEVTTRSLAALKQFADGKNLWHRGKFDDAMTLFRAAVAADPDFAIAHAALGSGYYSYIYNQPDLGKQEYEKALSLASRTTAREGMIIQVNYVDDQGHVADAEELYRAYLQRYPDDWTMLMDYARVLRRHGQQKEALAAYKEVLRVAPDDPRALVEMATAYNSTGRYPDAIAAYQEAFKIELAEMTAGNINREYGFTLVANHQEDEAVQVFSRLLAIPSQRQDGLRSLGALDLFHGRYASAQRKYAEALALNERSNSTFAAARCRFMLSVIAAGQGDVARQLQQLDAIAVVLPKIGGEVAYGSLVGQEYARAGTVGKAEKIETEIAPLADAHDAEATGYLHLLQGEIALAHGDADHAVQLLDIRDPMYGNEVTSLAAEALGRAYDLGGKTSQAIEAYEGVLHGQNKLISWEGQQRWVGAEYALAQDYWKVGNKTKASEAVATLLDQWRNADTNLPIYKQALALKAKLRQ